MPEILVNDFAVTLQTTLAAAGGAGTTFTVSPAAPAEAVGGTVRCRAVVNGVAGEIFTATVTTTTSWTVVARAAEDAARWPAQSYPVSTPLEVGLVTSDGFAALLGQAAATTRVVHVDSAGADATGLRGRADKPFLTPAAAAAAAQSGDAVVARPGAYAVTAPVAKAGVGWHLPPGTTVTRSDGGAGGIFDDGGAAMDYTVDGAGVVALTAGSGGPASAVRAAHPSSNVSVRARRVSAAAAGASDAYAVGHENGVLSVDADVIEATTTTGVESAVWWVNGSLHVRAGVIRSAGGWGLYTACNAAPTGEANVHADEITGQAPLSFQGSNAAAGVWVRTLTVRGTDPTQQAVLVTGNSRYYVDAQKIFGRLRALALGGGAGLTYVRVQKWSAIANGSPGSAQLVQVTSGTHQMILDVQEADPAGFAGDMITVNAGTVEIRGMRYVAGAGALGVTVGGGTLRLVNCLIDTSANSAADPLTVSGGAVELVDCVLVANSTREAITAGSAQTVQVRGVLSANRPVNANVTLAGGPLVRTDAKPAVAGSRGGNAALASLLGALAGLNLVTDSTSP